MPLPLTMARACAMARSSSRTAPPLPVPRIAPTAKAPRHVDKEDQRRPAVAWLAAVERRTSFRLLLLGAAPRNTIRMIGTAQITERALARRRYHYPSLFGAGVSNTRPRASNWS